MSDHIVTSPIPVSEQALHECRGATIAGSPMTIDPGALDYLTNLLRKPFHDHLDGTTGAGAGIWAHDRPKMLFQSGVVGGLAALHATLFSPSAKQVPQASLMAAFGFVKAGCTVREQTTMPKIFTIYCAGVPLEDDTAMTFWKRAFDLAEAKA